jgi:cell wall assembly regulator SMI1
LRRSRKFGLIPVSDLDPRVSPLHDTWRRLTDLGTDAPDWIAAEPPATEAEIAAAEKALKRPLPPALVALLRLSRAWGWREREYDAVLFLPPDEIVAQTVRPRDPDLRLSVEDVATSRVQALVYGAGRTTFARTDYLFFQVDDAPPPGGRPGQVVSIDFEEGVADVVAESVEAFVAHGLACMKAQLEGGDPELAAPNAATQAAATAVAIPTFDPGTLPPPVPLPERSARPARAIKATDPLGAALVGIDAWLAQHVPPGMKRLKAGVTEKKIRQFLSAEGHALPEAMFPLFTTFNGQSAQRVPLLPCPLRQCPGLVLRGHDDVARGRDNNHAFGKYAKPSRQYAAEPAGVKCGYWRKDWWPIARSTLDDPHWQVTLFVDYDPAAGGTPGQVVLDFVRGGTDAPEQGERHVVARSVQAYFDGVLAAMQGGAVEFRDGKGVAWMT